MATRTGLSDPRLLVLSRCAIASVLLALVWPTAAGAQAPSPNDPTSADLVESPGAWDGKTVTYTGEVIGEVMVRGEMAWLHVNDDPYYLRNVEEGAELGGYNSGHAVWLPAELTEGIAHFGDYKHEGDVVMVTGVFNAACPEHGGDMDIHATALTIEIPGRDVIDEVKPVKALWAGVLTLLAVALWFAQRRSTLSLERGLVRERRGR